MHDRHSLSYTLERSKRLIAIKSHDLQKRKARRDNNKSFGKVPQEWYLPTALRANNPMCFNGLQHLC